MPESNRPRFTIVGAGLAGALMACYLGRRGYPVQVYEQRPDPNQTRLRGKPARGRESEGSRGRSINLALSVRGVHALRRAGLADVVLKGAVPMRGRMIHSVDERLSFQPYSKNPAEFINSVSRAGLNATLLEAANAMPDVRISYDHRCIDADLDAASATLVNTRTDAAVTARGDILIGADGAFSAVRARMQRQDRFNYGQEYLEHGYKELSIPPDPGGGHRMEKNALHIWPRRSFMMIALPNQDGSFTCTIFWPFDGPFGFAAVKTSDDVRRFFKEHFPDAVPLMPTLEEDYVRNPTSSLATVRCGPWYVRDKVVLIGDAAHAVVPFYGQGINAGFEDCVVLDECIQRHAPDFGRVFGEYYRQRKEHTDALATLAVENFIEMRDHVGSPSFLRKKKRERRLQAWFPRWYVPLYSMVTFSRIPYAQTVQRARDRDRVVSFVTRLLGVILLALVVSILWWVI